MSESSTEAPTSSSTFDSLKGPRADLARVIPRRPRVGWGLTLAFAVGFAALLTPTIMAERIFVALGAGHVATGEAARMTVRVPPFAGYDTADGHLGGGGGGGVLIARGDRASAEDARRVLAVDEAMPHGAVPYLAYFMLAAVLAALFAHHTRRSTYGRLVRVQLVNFGLIAIAAIAVKTIMLTTSLSVLVAPVALFALLPTMALDRVVGLATGTLAALAVSLVVPFDVGIACLLLVQAGVAGIVIPERPKSRVHAVLLGGGAATLLSTLTYPLLVYLTTGKLPIDDLHDPLHSAWLACALGPALATALALPLLPLYQLLVGEITHGRLIALEDLSHPLLRQIADKAPGSWQHSLMMANMAELAANAIGANGRLVRVGAYFHDLGKSLQPKYFIENLEPGETSPHDQLPPRVSCDAIFSHVTEGIRAARAAGLHERVVDFMHMHHGNGVLEYFWMRQQEQGNTELLTIEHFRYPGVPPHSRETAILAICDAVEAASRTLKKPDTAAIDQLVTRIVYGKLHLGQLDESGLSMRDLRRVSDSLRDTIRHANHGRIEYPWQNAQQDASASGASIGSLVQTGPRLDSLDRPAKADPIARPATVRESQDAYADTGGAATPKLRVGRPSDSQTGIEATAPATSLPSTPAPADPSAAHAWHADDSPARSRTDSKRLKIDMRTQVGVPEAPKRPTPPPPPQPIPPSPEAAAFAAEAREVLHEASKEIAAMPKEDAQANAPAARKRAATLPPTPMQLRRPPTVQPPPIGRRAPTVPPEPKLTLPGPLTGGKPPATPGALPGMAKFGSTVAGVPAAPTPVSSDAAITLPAVPRRPRAELVDETVPAVDEDASTTQPRLDATRTPDSHSESPGDDTQPRIELPLIAPAVSHPAMSGARWRDGLTRRVEAALDDEFGAETPIVAPTRAELQALLNHPPDVTRKQSLEEMEALHRATRERPSQPELELTRRAPPPTAEVDEADIEAAIELAPPARKTGSIGVQKKKPTKE